MPVEGESWSYTVQSQGCFSHRPLRAKTVPREEKLSVKVVWRVENPDRPGWDGL